ncbi:MAG: hypothetical protein ACOYNY_47310, partial [Caldilineaceae bacterium]
GDAPTGLGILFFGTALDAFALRVYLSSAPQLGNCTGRFKQPYRQSSKMGRALTRFGAGNAWEPR